MGDFSADDGYDFDRLGFPDWINVPDDWRLVPMIPRPHWGYLLTHKVFEDIPNPDPLTNIGKTGISVAPTNLRQFLRRAKLHHRFEIIRYNVLNDRRLWRTLPRYPDAIFLMFTAEATAYYEPYPVPYNRFRLRYGGFWQDRQIGIVTDSSMEGHRSQFNELRYRRAMERSRYWVWD